VTLFLVSIFCKLVWPRLLLRCEHKISQSESLSHWHIQQRDPAYDGRRL